MELTHFDEQGNARMVDVSEKARTYRTAVAVGQILLSEECYQTVASHGMKKGDVLAVAQVAGIMGAKKTSELIPLCHPLPVTKISVTFQMLEQERAIEAVCTVSCTGKTGVEMEALTGCTTALLTIYDMCKAVDKGMTITGVYLRRKDGGKSGPVRNAGPRGGGADA